MAVSYTELAQPANATHGYLGGQMRPSHGPLLDAFMEEGEAGIARWKPDLDLRYGTHPRAVFDFYRSPEPWRGTLGYLHAGYWQSRDKAQFRFIAHAFLRHGVDVALINYPLCPDVTLRRLVETVTDAVPTILGHVSARGRGGTGLIVAGHSAGAHLAVELAAANWSKMPSIPIQGIVAISGVYELAPLLATPLNDKLGLDQDEARQLSPIHRIQAPLPPAHFVVGGLETPEFIAQSAAMHETWRRAGGVSRFSAVANADHFSVLRELGEDGVAYRTVLEIASAG